MIGVLNDFGPTHLTYPNKSNHYVKMRDGKLSEKTINEIFDEYLTPIHSIDPVIRVFISSYIALRHVGDAARSAGITKTQGNKLLNKKDIQNCIKAIGNASARKYGFDASEIAARVNEVVQVDIIDIFNNDGTVRNIHDMEPEVRRAIKEFEVEEVWENDMNGFKIQTGRIVKVKLYDKMKGSELLGREEGMFSQSVKHEHTHDIGKNASQILLGSVNRGAERLREVNRELLDEAKKEIGIDVGTNTDTK